MDDNPKSSPAETKQGKDSLSKKGAGKSKPGILFIRSSARNDRKARQYE